MVMKREHMKNLYLFLLVVSCAVPKQDLEEPSVQLSPVESASSAPSEPAQPGAGLAPAKADPAMERLLSELHMAASYPCSRGPRFENDSSVKFVLDNIDEAHPILLKMIEENKVGAIDRAFRILVIAGKEESLPTMEKILLSNDELDAPSAGNYLGIHPSANALPILLKALSSTQTHTLFGATLGLMGKKDLAACEPLRGQMNRKDDSQRYYVIQAAGELGCFSSDELKAIAKKDPSGDIRDKAKQLAASPRPSGTPLH
jgi:hypothetical protein